MEKTREEQFFHIKGVIESILFINEKPVTLEQIKKVLETVSVEEIEETMAAINKEYEERKSGMTVVEIAGGYQMLSNPAYAVYIRSFFKTKQKEKLSRPALECLAIIAYRQPVTRADIESIRGVNSDGVVTHLLEKELIKVVGRKDIAGKPYMYGTTKEFLEYFGLKTLEDLPKLEEFPALLPAEGKEGETASLESGPPAAENKALAEDESLDETPFQEEAKGAVREENVSLRPQVAEAILNIDGNERKDKISDNEPEETAS